MALNNSEIASNRPWTSMLIFWGIPELIVLTLVTSLALTNVYIFLCELAKVVVIPLQRENTTIELLTESTARASCYSRLLTKSCDIP